MSGGVLDEEKAEVLSKFSNSMRISGYDAAYRFEVIKGALKIHKMFECHWLFIQLTDILTADSCFNT